MLIILGAIAILAIIAMLTIYLSPKETGESPIVTPDEECCGAHETCEIDLTKLSEEIIYFEDEELDLYSGKAESIYRDDDIEQFREVLYTLKKKEINEWLHSLELRKINIPDILKPEVRMLLSE